MSKLNPLTRPVQPSPERTPERPGSPAAAPSNTAARFARDGFAAGPPSPHTTQRLGFGLPDFDLPEIDLPDLPSIDDIKDAVGGFLGDLKDKIIEGGVEALFDALEALPGDIDNEELRKLQDLGQVKAPERGLHPEEREALEAIYGDSIDYDEVVVREGDIGLFNRDDRPLVLGNTILVPEGRLDDETGRISTEDLVHEAAHLWQFQHGGIDYIKDSLQAQGTQGSGAYEFEEDVLAGTPFDELGTEQQAHLLESAYEQGYFEPGANKKFYVDGRDMTAYLEEALRNVRQGRGGPGGPPLVS